MDNYKIKVKDEAESKEAQELLKQLGFHEEGFTGIGLPCYLATWDGGYADYYFGSLSEGRKREELTITQLRDLVVLKRNDVKDATHTCENGFKYIFIDYHWYLMTTDGWFQVSVNPKALKPILTVQAVLNDLDGLREEYKDYHKDPALISGDVALANVHKCIVQYLHDDEPYGRWTTITDHLWSQYHLGMFLDPDTKFKFRFKPQTIKLELELPKPFEPEEDCHVYILDDGKTDGYRRYSYEVHGDKGNTFIGIWKTEDEIKQVVEQLRKIRGTNS
ncbi:Uncharacterised protein [Acinetobacter baumannii]|uniref:hypothetical protein n=1 Tax=Acinetobacter baumannii TaxID=470 RepID=UPI000DE7AF7B|nr:hypothetical protein [Acinetobacter baumannii]MCA4384348.1 hypothetical protein [Acinetobacter baumannii]SSQ27656.1 Uncharacterised protein [Acinetobacter baumannii]